MAKYRSKPFEIEAIQLEGNAKEIIVFGCGKVSRVDDEWLGKKFNVDTAKWNTEITNQCLQVICGSGLQFAHPLDWIVKFENGDCMVMPDKDFIAEYVPV